MYSIIEEENVRKIYLRTWYLERGYILLCFEKKIIGEDKPNGVRDEGMRKRERENTSRLSTAHKVHCLYSVHATQQSKPKKKRFVTR